MCVAPAGLPETDHRLNFAEQTDAFDVLFALPERPGSIAPENFALLRMGPGVDAQNLRELLRLRSLLRQHRVDVAHMFSTQLTSLGPLVARSAGVVPIITVTGLGRAFDDDGGGMRTKVVRLLYRSLFLVSAAASFRVLFQNPSNMEVLTRGLPKRLQKRCELIGSALDPGLFSDQEPPERTAGRPKCVLVARLSRQKGIADFIEVATRLSSEADFTLVGPSSDEYPEVAASVHDAHERGVIDYTGPVHGEDLRALLSAQDIFVFPSYGEGLPRVVLEASLSNLATAGYDIAGNRAVLGVEADLAPLRDVDALTEPVAKFVRDPRARESAAIDAKARVRRDFDPQRYIDNIERILHDVQRARSGSDDVGG